MLVYSSAPPRPRPRGGRPRHRRPPRRLQPRAHRLLRAPSATSRPSGESLNVCDGLLRHRRPGTPAARRRRLPPGDHRALADGLSLPARPPRKAAGPSSGAHPRHARNPGSGEPLATATTLVAADQAVHHDPARPSAIVLPVRVWRGRSECERLAAGRRSGGGLRAAMRCVKCEGKLVTVRIEDKSTSTRCDRCAGIWSRRPRAGARPPPRARRAAARARPHPRRR